MFKKLFLTIFIIFIFFVNAFGASWNGIIPGHTDERLARAILGEPSIIWLSHPHKEYKTLKYNSEKAPPGTEEVNIIINQKTLKVERIDTKPTVKIDIKNIEQLYGKPNIEYFTDDLIKIQKFYSEGIEVQYKNNSFTVNYISFVPVRKQ